jgi:hypothetical protein
MVALGTSNHFLFFTVSSWRLAPPFKQGQRRIYPEKFGMAAQELSESPSRASEQIPAPSSTALLFRQRTK